ncbi:tyrosine-type recombinase/integrase [Leadbetterella byssophila]|uniref:tyrosine-type recombinase/integrase n=1 Tax=Leadbetterella byssophila TaxID=316068 RepID=UPI0039A067CC
MVDFFLSHLQHERRLSPHTIKSYKLDLEQLHTFLNGIDPSQISTEDLRAWVVSLSEDGLENRSINRKLASARAFFTFLQRKKIISQNPADLIKSLKTPKPLPVFLEERNTQDLFEQLEFTEDFEGLRDKLLLELLYGTGIRLSELISIQVKDLENDRVKVLGKRSKYRIIPLHRTLQDLIKRYLELHPKTDTHLLLTDKGEALYPVFVQRKVKHYLQQISTLTKTSPHVLRHTFATHLLNRGADLNAIKELLGHANLSATQIYTHNSIQKLKEVFQKAHPKA